MQTAPPNPHSPTTVPFGSGSRAQGRLGHWVKDGISRTINIPASSTATKSFPLGSITTSWAVGTQRGHCTSYLEGKVPILLGELVDFSVHLGFFSLQVLALPEGLVQAPHQAVEKEVGKEGVHAGSRRGYHQGSVMLDIPKETKGSKDLHALL